MNATQRILAIVLLAVLVSMPAIAVAQSSDAPKGPAAIIALDDNAGSQRTVTRMAEVLVSNDHEVIYGEQVFQKVSSSRARVSDEASREFSGISERIAAGVKSFFYEGYQESIDQLAPLLQLGIRRFPFVAQRPDIAAQLYEAGLVLLRAYKGQDQHEDAIAIAHLLVRHFPGRSPTLDSSPPDVIELIRGLETEVVDGGAAVGIKRPTEGDCVGLLNGTRVADGFTPVSAGHPVYLQVECDGDRGPLWMLTVKEGQRLIAPVPRRPIDHLNMVDDSFQSRRDAETTMAAIQFWGGFSEVIGVRHPDTQGNAPTLFGHLKEGSVTWTETNDVPALVGYIERTFDVEAKGAYAKLGVGPQQESASSGPDWLGIASVSGGAISIGTGILLVVLASGEEQTIICSGYADKLPNQGDCDDVENIAPLSREQFDSRVSSADTKYVIGYSLVGVGVGALGYGIYRLIWGNESATSASISPRSDGVRADFTLRF